MRHALPCLLICWLTTLHAQVDLGQLVNENVAFLELRGYLKPDFKWDMSGETQAALNEGINLMDEGTPRPALAEFEKAIELERDKWIIHYYKGVCLKQLATDQAAEYSLRQANRLSPGNFFILMELGKSLELRNKFDDAERFYERASEIDPKSALPHYMLASSYAKNNKLIRAKRKLAFCAEVDSTFLHGEVRLAIIESVESRDVRKATGRLEHVLQKDSSNRLALIFHAALVYDNNKMGSLRDLDRLVQLDPTNMNVRFLRGVLFTETGNYDRGFSDLRKVVDAFQLDDFRAKGSQTNEDKRIDIQYAGFYVVSSVYGLPDEDGARIKKAYCLLFVERFDEALRSIDEVSGARTNPLCLYLQGVINEHKRNHKQAFIKYDSALKFDPDIYEAHKKRGIYCTELKNWRLALFDFNEMFRINPASVSGFRFRGTVLYHMGDHKGALNDFNRYLAPWSCLP
jgi:tetratricopeptide (TPR) repeat protein